MWMPGPLQRKHSLATGAGLKQDRAMTSLQALAHVTRSALRGGMAVVGPAQRANNNNRNNASLPRAGD